MDLQRITAAPVPIETGGGITLISPPTIRGYGRLLALHAAHGRPGQTLIDYCASDGLPHLLHVAISRDHPNVTFEQAEEWSRFLPAESLLDLVRVTLTRPREEQDAAQASGETTEITQINWGEIFEHQRLRRYSYDQIASMTLDQIENALRGGKPVVGEGVPLTHADVVRLFEDDIDEHEATHG